MAGYANDNPYLIVKHATASQQVWVSGANWRYVEGDFPAGMKWKSNITDRGIRQIKEKRKRGKVVIVPEKYSTTDLEDARKQCSTAQAGTVKQ
jgi:hypothetical protein